MGKAVGVHCVRGNILHEECRQCALRPDRPCHFTPDILEMMRGQDRGIHEDTFTATMLLGCDRQAVIMSGDHDYYVDVESSWLMTRGHMVHALMEQAPQTPGYLRDIREVRLATDVLTRYGTYHFTGKPDLIRLKRIEDGTAYIDIVDYKSTSEIGHDKLEASEEHQMQVNMYCWLVSREFPGYIFNELGIVVNVVEVETIEILYADMKKTRRFVNGYTLSAKGKRLGFHPLTYDTLSLYPMQLLPMDVVEDWIAGRIEEKIEARVTMPPVLGEDKNWMCFRCPVKEYCSKLADEERRGR